MNDTPISPGPIDLTPITGLVKLEELIIGFNAISDLRPLGGLTNIHELQAAGNEIQDLDPLTNLAEMKWLDLHRNEIVDLAPLSGMDQLLEIDLHDNLIRDISPLVANAGIADGDFLGLTDNCLDLSPGSADMSDIHSLVNRGVSVEYQPQRECP